MKKIYFLGNIRNSESNYLSVEYVASNLVSYIGDILSCNFEIIYLNIGVPRKKWNKKGNSKYFHEYKRGNNQKIVEFSYGILDKMPNRVKIVNIKRNAFIYLKKQYQKGDKIIIYHSLGLMRYYKNILSIFGLNDSIILTAELYSDVKPGKHSIKREIKQLQLFHKNISMTPGITKKCFLNDKKIDVIYIYGSYKNLPIREEHNDKIHVVYAGTSSLVKKGFINSLKASTYLPSNFILHIYSNVNDEMLELIDSEFPNAHYEGYVEEEELYRIISQYDIGLATQDPTAKFNESSFPSKITNYFACGLNVVSSKSPSVIDSPFNNYVYFYDEDDSGKNLADAIINSSKNINKNKNKALIRGLDSEFKKSIKDFLES